MNPDAQASLLEKLDQLIQLSQTQNAPAESPAAQVILALVPILAIVMGAVLMFFFLLWHYQIKRELVRTNQFEYTSRENLRLITLLTGLLSLATGLPMTVLFILVEGLSYVILGGLIPLFAGIALIVFYGLSLPPRSASRRAER
ncbi:MAG: hypothetical protein KDK39_04750 [Leptospiraceae bacterium]|nr:hypothetical protein [Leptospiraceae bacterium]